VEKKLLDQSCINKILIAFTWAPSASSTLRSPVKVAEKLHSTIVLLTIHIRTHFGGHQGASEQSILHHDSGACQKSCGNLTLMLRLSVPYLFLPSACCSACSPCACTNRAARLLATGPRSTPCPPDRRTRICPPTFPCSRAVVSNRFIYRRPPPSVYHPYH